MSDHWLFCPDLRVGQNVLSSAEARHATGSLRLRAGDTVTVFDGEGHVGQGILASGGTTTPESAARHGANRRKQSTTVSVSDIKTIPPPEQTLTIIVAGCKGARLDWLVEKSTELGVTRLVSAEFERSVVRVGAQHVVKLRRTAIEACKQCHRACLPRIDAGRALAAAIGNVEPCCLLVAHRANDATTLGAWLTANASRSRELAIVIGPEGGLSPTELDFLQTCGGQVVRLADYVLRVETAAIAAAAAWAAWWGA